MDSTEERLHVMRGRIIDAFVLADELIAEADRLGITSGPFDPQIAERLAMRLLVKRFGWRVTSPGFMQRYEK